MRNLTKRINKALLFCVFTSLIVGCGGGGATVATSPSSTQSHNSSLDAQSSTTKAASANVSFSISFTPKRSGTANRLRPQYVSVSTQSLRILTDGSNPVVADLSPSSPDCSPNPSVSGSYICTASLNVPAGPHVFTVTAYDQPGAKGNVLSTNSTGSVEVSSSGVTRVPLVLDGYVQYVILKLATTRPPVDTIAAIDLTAVLQDADHNIIVGPAAYEHPVTLQTTDAAVGPLSKTLLSSPADTSGLTVHYNGTYVKDIIYSATALGLPAANVTNAVLTPDPRPIVATSTGALTTLIVGGTIYAFVPTSNMFSPNPSGLMVQVPLFNSGGIVTSTATHKIAAANVRIAPRFINPTIAGTGGVTACSGDQKNLRLYCINSGTANITVLDAGTAPAKVLKTIVTDATGALQFSGRGCEVCGVVYDPTDDAAIIGTVNGIEVYSSAGTHVSTTVANSSETFGYNPVTNQVFNPEYRGGDITGVTPSIDVIDVKSAKRYTLQPTPTGLSEPDQGAVDSTTNIGISSEEYTQQYYAMPLGSASFDPLTSSFTEPNPDVFTLTSGIFKTCLFADSGIAIDSHIHVAFFNAEFCDPGTIGAGQLPASATAAPSISSFAFAPVPATPDGQPFLSGVDPHAQATVFGTFGDYGVIFNRTALAGPPTYLAVTDLKKLLAAPRQASDPTMVDPTYNLLKSGVVTFIPI